MNEFRVKLTVRNNLLLSAMEAAGYGGRGGQGRFADDCGINHTSMANLINLKVPPITSDGEFSAAARAAMEVLGACPTDLWSEHQLTMRLRTNSAEAVTDFVMLQSLIEDHHSSMTLPSPEDILNSAQERQELGMVLACLSPQSERVMKCRLGIDCDPMTLEEVAQMLNLSRERIRQIESHAIRRLKDREFLPHVARAIGLDV